MKKINWSLTIKIVLAILIAVQSYRVWQLENKIKEGGLKCQKP